MVADRVALAGANFFVVTALDEVACRVSFLINTGLGEKLYIYIYSRNIHSILFDYMVIRFQNFLKTF